MVAAAQPPTPELPWLDEPLGRCLPRLNGHAVLLWGPSGVGQFDMAMAIAKAWLCERNSSSLPSLACGQCTSCRLFSSHTHPDLLVLLPEILAPQLGWGSGSGDHSSGDIRESKRKLSKEIKVDALRQAVTFAQQSSARGRAKVVVLHPAEQMNEVSANTLLKTLEEPPGLVRFLLSTGEPHQLLPTVRSRCQSLRMELPPREQSLQWLECQGIDGAEILLDACGGQTVLAADWAKQGVRASVWKDFSETVLKVRTADVSAWPLSILIDALQKLCHDALCVAVGAAPRYFPSGRVPSGRSVPVLTSWARRLSAQARHKEHPWTGALMVESLLIQAQRAMRTPAE